MESGNYSIKYFYKNESFDFNRNKVIDLNSLIYNDIMRRTHMEKKYGSCDNTTKDWFEKYNNYEKIKFGIKTKFKRVMKKKYKIKYDVEYSKNKTFYREKKPNNNQYINNSLINKKPKKTKYYIDNFDSRKNRPKLNEENKIINNEEEKMRMMMEKLIKARVEFQKEKFMKKEKNKIFDLNTKMEEIEKKEEKTHKIVNNLKINKKRNDSFSNLIESIKKKLEKNKKNGNSQKNNPNNKSYKFSKKTNKNNSKININNNSNICSNDKINIDLIPISHQNYNVFNRKKDFFNQNYLKILYEEFFNSKSNLKLFRKNNSHFNNTNNIPILININKIKLKEFEKLKQLIKSYINNGCMFAFERNKCSICLRGFLIENDISYLPCLHKFHYRCIIKWLNKNSICPICKYSMSIH